MAQILCHSSHLYVFYIIKKCFSQSFFQKEVLFKLKSLGLFLFLFFEGWEVTNSTERLNYKVLPFVFQFQKFNGSKFFVLCQISISFSQLKSTFLNFLKFSEIKEWEKYLVGNPFTEQLNYLVSYSTFQVKN